jgi:uncharacterized membrane protein affecting hemolysin expression
MLGLLRLPNFYAYGLLAFVVVLIVTGIYTAGQRAERNKQAAEMAKINAPIIEQRGKDEAEIKANEQAAETVDAAVKAKIKQTLILDGETAVWLGMVR